MQIWILVYDFYGIDSSRLAWTSDYWSNSSPLFRLSGPPNCETIDPLPAGCIAIDGSTQNDIMLEAAGSYWWVLVMSQVFHVFMCKTRFASVYTHGIFNNVVMWYGVTIELALIIIFIFVPNLNAVLVGLPFPSKFWPIFLLTWACFLLLSEGRKYIGLVRPEGFVAKYVNW